MHGRHVWPTARSWRTPRSRPHNAQNGGRETPSPCQNHPIGRLKETVTAVRLASCLRSMGGSRRRSSHRLVSSSRSVAVIVCRGPCAPHDASTHHAERCQRTSTNRYRRTSGSQRKYAAVRDESLREPSDKDESQSLTRRTPGQTWASGLTGWVRDSEEHGPCCSSAPWWLPEVGSMCFGSIEFMDGSSLSRNVWSFPLPLGCGRIGTTTSADFCSHESGHPGRDRLSAEVAYSRVRLQISPNKGRELSLHKCVAYKRFCRKRLCGPRATRLRKPPASTTFLFVTSQLWLRLPPHGLSPRRSCPRLVLHLERLHLVD